MPIEPNSDGTARRASLVPVGVMLAIASVLAIIVLMHHPVAHGGDAVAVLHSIRRQVLIDQAVHGSLAILFGLLTTSMILFAQQLGLSRFSVLLGVVAFGCGFVLIIMAVMIDGFLVPALALRCDPPTPTCIPAILIQLSYGALQIEYLTRFALCAIAIAVLSWSVALLATPVAPRWSGVLGMIAGLCQVAALVMTPDRLTPPSLLVIMAGQIAWYLIVAVLMITRQAPFGDLRAAPDDL